jgi:hypothetical protein
MQITEYEIYAFILGAGAGSIVSGESVKRRRIGSSHWIKSGKAAAANGEG